MKKTFIYILAGIAAMTLTMTACNKNTETPAAVASVNNSRTVIYTAGHDESITTLKTDGEWDALLDRFCSLAADGKTVTFYSIGRPQQQHPSGTKEATKEDIHYSTDSREEMKAWMKARESEGLTVSVSYDEQTGRWNGVARETSAQRQDLTDCYTGTITCVDAPEEDGIAMDATVPALVLADGTALILVQDGNTMICVTDMGDTGDNSEEMTVCGTVEQRQTGDGNTYYVLDISVANPDYMAGSWQMAMTLQSIFDATTGNISATSHDYSDGSATTTYTFNSDGTASRLNSAAGGTTTTATSTWSNDSDGMLCCDLLAADGGCWEVNWLSGTTLIVSRYTMDTDGSSAYYQIVFERIEAEK